MFTTYIINILVPRIVVMLVVVGCGPAVRPVHAQSRDTVANGAVIGAAVGAGAGVAFTYAVRDSDLTAGQYARSAIIFGALGAGVGVGVDALLSRAVGPDAKARRVLIAPMVWRDIAAVAVRCRW